MIVSVIAPAVSCTRACAPEDVDKEIRGEFTLTAQYRSRPSGIPVMTLHQTLAIVLDTAKTRLPQEGGVFGHGSLYKVSQAGLYSLSQSLRSADCVVLGDDAVTRRA